MRPFFVLCILALPVLAADPKPNPEADKFAIESLKDVHNRGADLYNGADAPGARAMYEGALRTIAPFLGHHPKIQKIIDEGLAAALKLDGAKAQAFKLHEVIEQVRGELKAAAPTELEPKKPFPKITIPPIRWPMFGN